MVNRGTVNSQLYVWDTGTLAWTVWDGALNLGDVTIGTVTDGGSGKTLKTAVVNISATGTLISAVTSKRIKVYSYKLVTDAALTLNFRSGASTALEGPCAFAANGGITENVEPPDYLFATAAGERLDLVISGSGNVGGIIRYWDDDAS